MKMSQWKIFFVGMFLKGFMRFPQCTLSPLLWWITMRCAGFMIPLLLYVCVFVHANALMYSALSLSLSPPPAPSFRDLGYL